MLIRLYKVFGYQFIDDVAGLFCGDLARSAKRSSINGESSAKNISDLDGRNTADLLILDLAFQCFSSGAIWAYRAFRYERIDHGLGSQFPYIALNLAALRMKICCCL